MKIGYVSLPMVLMTCLLVGCASIFSDSAYFVSIKSQPIRATITVIDENGKTVFSGRTPTTVYLDTKKGYFSGKDYTVTFEKEGYAKHTAQIRRGVDMWYIAGNFVIGGLIGWLIVDPFTGAMWTLDKECIATLSPITGSNNSEHAIEIVSIEDVPADLISRMKRIN